MKITFEMEDEQVDAVILAELSRTLEGFEEDLELRSDGKGIAIFDHDPVKDVLTIQEHIAALKLLSEYYGG